VIRLSGPKPWNPAMTATWPWSRRSSRSFVSMPLIAIRLQVMARKSLGGIQTDLGCRVLGSAGEAIPGLYAIGEAAGFGGGGVHGKRSLEGTFLGGCVFTGRLAAAAITGSELPLRIPPRIR